MPMYEYHCLDCKYTFDVKATMQEKEKGLNIACEKCGSTKLEQVFGGFSLLTNKSVRQRGGGCCGGNSNCCG